VHELILSIGFEDSGQLNLQQCRSYSIPDGATPTCSPSFHDRSDIASAETLEVAGVREALWIVTQHLLEKGDERVRMVAINAWKILRGRPVGPPAK
jgi:hypothetical protein